MCFQGILNICLENLEQQGQRSENISSYHHQNRPASNPQLANGDFLRPTWDTTDRFRGEGYDDYRDILCFTAEQDSVEMQKQRMFAKIFCLSQDTKTEIRFFKYEIIFLIPLILLISYNPISNIFQLWNNFLRENDSTMMPY